MEDLQILTKDKSNSFIYLTTIIELIRKNFSTLFFLSSVKIEMVIRYPISKYNLIGMLVKFFP